MVYFYTKGSFFVLIFFFTNFFLISFIFLFFLFLFFSFFKGTRTDRDARHAEAHCEREARHRH